MFKNFFRVASASPRVKLANVDANVETIASMIGVFAGNDVDLGVFPELCLTGYTCGDLYHDRTLLDAVVRGLARLAEETSSVATAVIVGAPVIYNNVLFNCGIVIHGGRVRMIVPKTYIPNYGEFYEKRWWQPADDVWDGRVTLLPGVIDDVPFGAKQLYEIGGVRIGIEICEDLWTPIPPSSRMAMAGAQIIANLSASDAVVGKYDYLCNLIAQQSARTITGYVYASAGFGESTTDLVFDGKTIIAENGWIARRNSRWQTGDQSVIADIDIEAIDHDRLYKSSFADCAMRELAFGFTRVVSDVTMREATPAALMRPVDPTPFVPSDDETMNGRCSEVINIQVAALAQRLSATNTRSLVIGISGGLDSTLALLVAVKTFDRLGYDRKGITGVTMPGFGTSGRTHTNAVTLMEALGISTREISIAEAVTLHFKEIGHDPSVRDVTYENAQARQRTYLLMDIANQTGGMVLGTGDLSELALGWATYNGDHMSMYGVNAGVPKTLVRHLVRWLAEKAGSEVVRKALIDVADTPISPELIPVDESGNISQKTEDLVGPYELHDFFLFHFIRFGRSPRKIFFLAQIAFKGLFDDKTILHWLRHFCRRFFNQQFKRSCMPDGPKVGSVSLSPRGDWRMPSDAQSAIWLREVDQLQDEIK